MQAITYNEFLPILIGEGAIEDYEGFRSNVNPAISLEFSTAIYRFGHSLLSPTIARMNEDGSTHAAGNLPLRDAFQQRGIVERPASRQSCEACPRRCRRSSTPS